MSNPVDPLITQAAQGDADAFSQLIEAHYDLIYRCAFKWVLNQSDAEDIAQEACIKAARAIRQFRQESALSTWLYRITINCAKDFLRQQAHRATEPLDDATGYQNNAYPTTHEAGHIAIDSAAYATTHSLVDEAANDNAITLWQLVQQLPDKLRDATLLVYAEGHTHLEAAAIMQCQESTVSWYIHQAKKQLSQQVQNNA